MAKPSTNPDARFRVPAWGRSFLTPGEYADFTRLVALELAKHELPIEADMTRGQAVIRQPDRVDGRLSLVHLAQLCKARPRPAWAAQIADFLDGVRRTYLYPASILEPIERFEAAAPRLKVRLHPEEYLRHPEAPHLVLRRIADGISGLLVCDLGFVNVSVPAEIARGWGRPTDALFELAVKNVRAEGRLAASLGAALGGFPVDLLCSESNYAASHLLFFEDYFEYGTRYGALVGVPQRHVLVRHVIRDARALEAIPLVLRMTDDWYDEGPGAISRELYWWRPGKLERLLWHRVGGVVALLPSDEFQEVVLDSILGGN
jgi:hypothetical protein